MKGYKIRWTILVVSKWNGSVVVQSNKFSKCKFNFNFISNNCYNEYRTNSVSFHLLWLSISDRIFKKLFDRRTYDACTLNKHSIRSAKLNYRLLEPNALVTQHWAFVVSVESATICIWLIRPCVAKPFNGQTNQLAFMWSRCISIWYWRSIYYALIVRI